MAKFAIYGASRGSRSEYVFFYSHIPASTVSRPLPVNQGNWHSLPSGDFFPVRATFSCLGKLATIIRPACRKKRSFCSEMNGERTSEFSLHYDYFFPNLDLRNEKVPITRKFDLDFSQLGQLLT